MVNSNASPVPNSVVGEDSHLQLQDKHRTRMYQPRSHHGVFFDATSFTSSIFCTAELWALSHQFWFKCLHSIDFPKATQEISSSWGTRCLCIMLLSASLERLSPAPMVQLVVPCKPQPLRDWFHLAPGSPVEVILCPRNKSYSHTPTLSFLSYLVAT